MTFDLIHTSSGIQFSKPSANKASNQWIQQQKFSTKLLQSQAETSMENLKRCFKKIYDRNVMLENDNKTHKQIIKELLDVNKVLSSKNQNLEREFGLLSDGMTFRRTLDSLSNQMKDLRQKNEYLKLKNNQLLTKLKKDNKIPSNEVQNFFWK